MRKISTPYCKGFVVAFKALVQSVDKFAIGLVFSSLRCSLHYEFCGEVVPRDATCFSEAFGVRYGCRLTNARLGFSPVQNNILLKKEADGEP